MLETGWNWIVGSSVVQLRASPLPVHLQFLVALACSSKTWLDARKRVGQRSVGSCCNCRCFNVEQRVGKSLVFAESCRCGTTVAVKGDCLVLYNLWWTRAWLRASCMVNSFCWLASVTNLNHCAHFCLDVDIWYYS